MINDVSRVKIFNSTCYNTEDIRQLLIDVSTAYAKYCRANGTNGAIKPIEEMHVRMRTSRGSVKVFTEIVHRPDGTHIHSGRLVLVMPRKLHLFASDLEALQQLSAENPCVPDDVLFQVKSSILRGLEGGDLGRSVTNFHEVDKGLAATKVCASMPQSTSVRIMPREDAESKAEVTKILTYERRKKAKQQLDMWTNRRIRLLEDLAKTEAKIEHLTRKIGKFDHLMHKFNEEN